MTTTPSRPNTQRVSDLMTADPIVVRVDAPLAEVAETLDRHDISGVPVVDSMDDLVGVISRTDLARVRATDDLWARWPGLAARHLMTAPAITIAADAPLADAIHRMEAERIHRLVVVDDSGSRPIGVLSTTDIVRAMTERRP